MMYFINLCKHVRDCLDQCITRVTYTKIVTLFFVSYVCEINSLRSNISKTSASVSSGVPNTEKQMKARGRRPSAFIVSRCLEPLMKHEAQVFEMASQTSVKISWNFFRRIGHQKV